jgi:ribosome biogenesis protein UTP30
MPSTSTTAQEIQPKLQEKQVKKAVHALLTHLSKQADQDQKKPNLLDEQDSKYLWLTITTKKSPAKASLKPHVIELPHSILPLSPEICLITKDPQREFKDLVAAQGLQSAITKVINSFKNFLNGMFFAIILIIDSEIKGHWSVQVEGSV